MHGPDAAAKSERTGENGDLPGDRMRTVACFASQLQRHTGGEYGNSQ